MKLLAELARRAVDTASGITGRRFVLLVASSLFATSAIVAAAMTDPRGIGPLEALVGRGLAASEAPAEAASDAAEPPITGGGKTHQRTPGPGAAPSGPLPAPASRAPAAPPTTETEKPAATPAEPAPAPGPIQHVFIVSLASSGYDAAFGAASQMPYLASTLRPQGLLLSDYTLLDDAALPNSLAAVSGQPPNPATREDCPAWKEFPATAAVSGGGVVAGSGCVYPVTTLSLADQLAGGQLTWSAYMGDMADPVTGQPGNCVHPEPDAAEAPLTGGYSSRLNPFVHFHSLLDLGDCATNDVPLTELEQDLRKLESTPNYAYVSPDLCDAGVTGQCPAGTPDGPASADAFLSTWAPKILSSPAYRKDGLLIVTFGLANPAATDSATGAPITDPDPLKAGTLLVSKAISPGATDAVAYDPYSLLKSVEDLFALDHLARANSPRVRSFAPAATGETAATEPSF